MGYPQTPSPPHLYSQELQLKLYQAFIFSIPILFSIILFLLFYLFYLKRRTSTISSSPPILPTSLNQATPVSPSSEMGLKGNLEEKLPVIMFDEELRKWDSQCCVCLGEYEIKEELNQIPSCKHVFHVDCIRHWLHSNSTCPLCRCSVDITTTKNGHPDPPIEPNQVTQDNGNFNQNRQQQRQLVLVSSDLANCSREQRVVAMEGSSSASHSNEESVVLSIQVIHDS